MGKRKRGKKNRALTHDEIWDDSALLESWEEAAEEYKLYHSIQAKGENLEDALRNYEANEAAMAAQEETENALDAAAAQQIADAVHAQEPFPVAAETDDGDRPMDEGVGATHSSATEQEPMSKRQRKGEAESGPSIEQPEGIPAGGAFSSIPHMVLGTGDASNDNSQEDERLKNLMMAWYFAGYYTGLYEGQRRAIPE